MTHSEGYFDPGHKPEDPQEPSGIHHDDMPSGPWSAAAKSWEASIAAYQEWMENTHGCYLQIDEVSLLFFDAEHVFNFITQAVGEEGVWLSQTASDQVHVDPVRSRYNVHYWFLNHTDKPYRLELMLKDGNGLSPVHDQLRFDMMRQAHREAEESGDDQFPDVHPIKAPVVVHLSFKAPSQPDYQLVNNGFNENEDCEFVQFCRSSYGQFAYWRVNDLWDNVSAVYLKPRVNLRDAMEEAWA